MVYTRKRKLVLKLCVCVCVYTLNGEECDCIYKVCKRMAGRLHLFLAKDFKRKRGGGDIFGTKGCKLLNGMAFLYDRMEKDFIE